MSAWSTNQWLLLVWLIFLAFSSSVWPCSFLSFSHNRKLWPAASASASTTTTTPQAFWTKERISRIGLPPKWTPTASSSWSAMCAFQTTWCSCVRWTGWPQGTQRARPHSMCLVRCAKTHPKIVLILISGIGSISIYTIELSPIKCSFKNSHLFALWFTL